MPACAPDFSPCNPRSRGPAREHGKASSRGLQRGGESIRCLCPFRESSVRGFEASQQDCLQADYLDLTFPHSLVVRTAHHPCANLHIHTHFSSLPRRSLKILVRLVLWAELAAVVAASCPYSDNCSSATCLLLAVLYSSFLQLEACPSGGRRGDQKTWKVSRT